MGPIVAEKGSNPGMRSVRKAIVDAGLLGSRNSEAARFLAKGARVWLPAALTPATSLVAAVAMSLVAVSFTVVPPPFAQANEPAPFQMLQVASASLATTVTDTDSVKEIPLVFDKSLLPIGGMIDQGPFPSMVTEADEADEVDESLPPLPKPNPRRGSATPDVPDYDADPEVVAAIIEGANAVEGVDAVYMMAVGSKESGFDPKAKARGSSGLGLFQFTNVSWMRAVKEFGAAHGLEEMAESIFKLDDGRMGVSDWDTRTRLLELRNDPYLSTVMAGELAMDDKRRLESSLGREADAVDMYFSHLLGISTATRFLEAVKDSPAISAKDVAARAARSNPAIFNDEDGRPRTAFEVHALVGADIKIRVKHYAALIGAVSGFEVAMLP